MCEFCIPSCCIASTAARFLHLFPIFSPSAAFRPATSESPARRFNAFSSLFGFNRRPTQPPAVHPPAAQQPSSRTPSPRASSTAAMGCCQSAEEYDSLDGKSADRGGGAWHAVPAVEYTRSRGTGGPAASSAITPRSIAGAIRGAVSGDRGRGGASTPDVEPLKQFQGLNEDDGGASERQLYTPVSEFTQSMCEGGVDGVDTNGAFSAERRRNRHTPRQSFDVSDGSPPNDTSRAGAYRVAGDGVTPGERKSNSGPNSTRNGLTPKMVTVAAVPAVIAAPPQAIVRSAAGLIQGLDRPATIAEGLHKMLILFNGPNWQPFSDSSEAFCHVHPVDWSTLNAGRFRTTITLAMCASIAKKGKLPWLPEGAPGAVTLDDVYEAAVAVIGDDDGVKTAKSLNIFKYDTLLEDYQRLGPVDKGSNLVHLMYGSPVFGIAKRDAVVVMSRATLDDTLQRHYLLTAPSCRRFTAFAMLSQPSAPERKGYQRSTVHCQGFAIRILPDGAGVEVSMMLSAEPGGSIPLWLVDKLRGEQLKMLIILRKLIVEHVSSHRGAADAAGPSSAKGAV